MGDGADPGSSRVTTKSPADPFDPYPIGTTSPNSASDLLQPRSDVSSDSPEETQTQTITTVTTIRETQSQPEATSDRQLPAATENKDPSSESIVGTHRWALTLDTSTPKQEGPAESQATDQTMLIKFERKSNENDSPWDRWTSPTVYNIATEEEEEQEQRPKETQTQTITTVTTIRETQSQPEATSDRYETYSRSATVEEESFKTPEPEAKKAFVYVKEYVNSTELSLHNARDTNYGGSGYLTSSSVGSSYSSPSTYFSSPTSSCTYCGELVGNDAKISIDHLDIHSHPACFKCGVCGKPMGELLDSMFLHGGKVHCETCYARAFE
ncbi:zinc finger protein 185 [Brachionichthys hirsutus]|uniref:zinc finger protein 185 n=1 Tax=Brachionichthys hirsutus TaxID=412623 RepID=UPI0036053503